MPNRSTTTANRASSSIDDFLDADELADRDDQSGDSYYDKVFTQRLNLWMDHDGMRRLMLDTRLGKTMKATSSSFHKGLLAHGAGANMTPGRRRAMTCAYMPDGEIFNGQANVLPPEYVATLSEGDVLDNDEQNPLLYHKSKPAVSP